VCGDSLDLIAWRQRRLRHVVSDTLTKDDARDVEHVLGIRAFATLDAALAERPDAMFVCTPSSQHMAACLQAARAGVHLFIEKPLSHSLDGVDELAAVVRERPLTVLVASQWRFHPCVRALRALLADDALGVLQAVTFEYTEYLPDWHPYEDYRTSYAANAALGGGVVLTQIHDYDLACWLFGPPKRVRATGGHLSNLEIDVEDTVDATLEGGACPVRVRQTFAGRPPRRVITVQGAQGEAVADLLGGTCTSPRGVQAFPDVPRNAMFLDEVSHFLDCVRSRQPTTIPLHDGVVALRTALAVKTAMQQGTTVTLA
jgi:predicted dehydrogenase